MADHKKEIIVEKLKEQLASAKGSVFTTYSGLTVAQDTELRRELRAAGVSYHVVKNTMLRRAADALGLEGNQKEYDDRIFVAINSDMFPRR